jgi:chemotaxis protein methyltransferase CheR
MSLSQTEFAYIRALVQKRSAIVLEADKVYLAEARLGSLARREGFDSMAAFMVYLLARPSMGLHQKVVEAMTTNETSFFRDIHPFTGLRQTVLPALIKARSAERRLHIWSAACSSGQEPFSVAMLLREYFPSLTGWNLRIIGSDLSTAMLERARRGRYTQMEVNRGLPAQLLVKHFRKDGADWQLKDEIRKMVEFSSINLIDDWPALPPLDLILLRNVLIYFDVPTRKQILKKIRRVLRPQGYLFLGGAETTFNLDEGFERVQLDKFSGYRVIP